MHDFSDYEKAMQSEETTNFTKPIHKNEFVRKLQTKS